MTAKQDDVFTAMVVIILVCLAMAFLTGCIEEQQSPKVWGKGDPPADWQEYFGNDNSSRVDFMQSRAINEIGVRLRTLEINQYVPDPNEMRDVKRRLSELETSTYLRWENE